MLSSARPILFWKIPTQNSGWGMIQKNNFVMVTAENYPKLPVLKAQV